MLTVSVDFIKTLDTDSSYWAITFISENCSFGRKIIISSLKISSDATLIVRLLSECIEEPGKCQTYLAHSVDVSGTICKPKNISKADPYCIQQNR